MLAILTNFQDNIFKIIATCFIKTSRWFIIINIAIIIIIVSRLEFTGSKEPGPLEGLRGDTGPTRRGPLENIKMFYCDATAGIHLWVIIGNSPEMVAG